jgi:large subunit ribosomal protein L5
MAQFRELYKQQAIPALQEQFGFANPMRVPKITKVVLNMGLGEAVTDKKVLESAAEDLTKISGQKVVVTKARKSIAGFKIREGRPVGLKVTLRPEIDYDKIDALRGLDITITTTAQNDDEGRALLAAMRFPFRGMVTAEAKES